MRTCCQLALCIKNIMDTPPNLDCYIIDCLTIRLAWDGDILVTPPYELVSSQISRSPVVSDILYGPMGWEPHPRARPDYSPGRPRQRRVPGSRVFSTSVLSTQLKMTV